MPRRTDIDTLRGLLLVVMTLTHLPTRASAWADQPFGFVSMAEGFIFLSAFLAGRSGLAALRRKVWTRVTQIYCYHIALTVFALTVVAAFAIATGHVGLRNLLGVYFANPLPAMLGSFVLAYQPPLLDILPMYVVFLALTPMVMKEAATRGWTRPLCLSLLLWLFAQLGGKQVLYGVLASASGWPLPIESLGAFDWLAWQVLWIGGLFVASQATAIGAWLGVPGNRFPLLLLALPAGVLLFMWRHRLGGVPIDAAWTNAALDKWHLGILRLLNFALLALLARQFLLPLFSRVRLRFLSTLGEASLPVFVAHILACIVAIALVNEANRTSPMLEVAILVCTLGGMWWVARRATRPRSGDATNESSADRRVPA